jgi:hypothetical protein
MQNFFYINSITEICILSLYQVHLFNNFIIAITKKEMVYFQKFLSKSRKLAFCWNGYEGKHTGRKLNINLENSAVLPPSPPHDQQAARTFGDDITNRHVSPQMIPLPSEKKRLISGMAEFNGKTERGLPPKKRAFFSKMTIFEAEDMKPLKKRYIDIMITDQMGPSADDQNHGAVVQSADMAEQNVSCESGASQLGALIINQ